MEILRLQASSSLPTKQTPVQSCFKGTRENALKTIQDWATTNVDDGGKHAFWLYGELDIGTPTIAMLIAKWVHEEKLGGECFLQGGEHVE